MDEFTKSLDNSDATSRHPKLFIFSITHGAPADSVIEKIRHTLRKGDILLDGGNEHYRFTERRQDDLGKHGVHWVGCGVSGGYQSARRGPSMSPGGDEKAIKQILPLLRKFAAKDHRDGHPCVEYMGPRGSGHYIKMVHNGIEYITISYASYTNGFELCQKKTRALYSTTLYSSC